MWKYAAVQRCLQRIMNRTPPSGKKTRQWRRNFIETGNVQSRSRSQIPRTNDEKVNPVRERSISVPITSIRSVEDQL